MGSFGLPTPILKKNSHTVKVDPHAKNYLKETKLAEIHKMPEKERKKVLAMHADFYHIMKQEEESRKYFQNYL